MRIVLAVLLLVLPGCYGNLNDKELIKAVNKAGCVLKTVTREDGEIESIICQETTRYTK